MNSSANTFFKLINQALSSDSKKEFTNKATSEHKYKQY